MAGRWITVELRNLIEELQEYLIDTEAEQYPVRADQ
nr:MAG TPA: hypothetical protein [Caudoviricetes sp.]